MEDKKAEEVTDPAQPEAASLPPGELAEKAPIPEKAPPPAKRKRGFFSRLLRWLLVFLIIFGLGALAAIYFFYIPLQQKSAARETQMAGSSQDISNLESRVESLQSLDTKNQELQSQVNQANVEIALLRAQLDIAKAQVLLVNNDPTGARKALSGTDKQLETIRMLVPQKQQSKVGPMQDRLKLAISEMASNTQFAQSDLNLLLTSLEDLEKSISTTP